MVKPRACKKCRLIHFDEKCPNCGSNSYTESFKGKIEVMDPEKSEIAQKLKLSQKGTYTIKSN